MNLHVPRSPASAMAGRPGVIQGFFPGGRPRIIPPSPRPAVQSAALAPGRGVAQPAAIAPKPMPGPAKPIGPPATPPPVVPPIGTAVALPATFSLPARAAGQPLPHAVQARMESLFSTSFADVRIHVGPAASAIGALALTHGSQVYFAAGQFNPDTAAGRRLLGHELAHVVQQRAGRVRNPYGQGLALIHDHLLEAEAEVMGQRAAASLAAEMTRRPGAPASRPTPGPSAVLPARTPPAVLPTPAPARPAILPARALPVQRAARREEAKFLKDTATKLFDDSDDNKLMEVQTSIFDKRLFIASNYPRGNDDSKLKQAMPTSYQHASKTYANTGDYGLAVLAAELHAEQQILYELAKVLRNTNKTNPPHVTVVGTKRPCSVCRRVLLAFDKALIKHYPEVHLHFIDLTGANTTVAALDLAGLANDTQDQTFRDFAATYAIELEKYRGMTLPGEDVSNSIRTAAKADLDDLL